MRFTYNLDELARYYRCQEALMAHWRRVLPETTMLEVQYETLVDRFEAEVRRILNFCGLPWDDHCLRFYETKRSVHTASASQVRQPLFRSAIGRWHPYAQWLTPLQNALSAPANDVRKIVL